MKFDSYILRIGDKPNSPVLTLNGNNIEFNQFKNIYDRLNNALLHGINDVKDIEKCKPEKWYTAWIGLIRRGCRGEDSYAYASVDYSWLIASNFKKWFDENNYEVLYTDDRDMLAIDKDIRVPGNKMYSPETCMLVPSKINRFFVGSYKVTRDYTLSEHNRYVTRIRYFDTDETKNLLSKDPYKLAINWAQEKNIQLRERVIPYFKRIVHPDYINKGMPQLVLKTLEEYDFVKIIEQNKKLLDSIMEQIEQIVPLEQRNSEMLENLGDILSQIDPKLLKKLSKNVKKSDDGLLDLITYIISSEDL